MKYLFIIIFFAGCASKSPIGIPKGAPRPDTVKRMDLPGTHYKPVVVDSVKKDTVIYPGW